MDLTASVSDNVTFSWAVTDPVWTQMIRPKFHRVRLCYKSLVWVFPFEDLGFVGFGVAS